MPFTVCLTGGIGSGKSTVGRAFEALGVALIDTDALAHALSARGGGAIPAIRAAFGERYLTPDGALDRKAMRELVFADADARRRLEAILHPMIRTESERLAAAATSPYVILMIPLLVESGRPRERCQRILVVDCAEEEQVRRVMARSGLARAEVEAILASQATRAARLAVADEVIDNSGDPASLPARVAALHRTYLALAAGGANP
ncbi:MAG: dephospho-CoA kinase [Burkholderiales bacterium]|jgi:dephospho-CoA kinase|nr:dephospho-CoA kinase [Burkholderiales bacterium]